MCALPSPPCPCEVLDRTRLESLYLYVDVSQSAFQFTSDEGPRVKASLAAAASDFLAGHATPGATIPPINCLSFDRTVLGGCSAQGRGDHTDLRAPLAHISALPPAHRLAVLFTDGITSLGQSPEDCKGWSDLAGQELARLLKEMPDLRIAIVRTKTKEGSCAPSFTLHCGDLDRRRCKDFDLPARETPNATGSDRVVREAFTDVLREFLLPEPLPQQAPTGDTSSVVLVGDESAASCTGAVVADRVVLTAKHCVRAARVTLPPGNGGPFAAAVTARADHPSLDVSLLRLDRAPPGQPFLMRAGKDREPPQGALRFTGYGALRADGAGFGKLKDISLTALGWGCDGRRPEETGCRPSAEMVLPGSAGLDTCIGDSGGPLLELVPTPSHCAWRLVGVASRRVADAKESCGRGGIYTRVDGVRDWIDETIRDWGNRSQ